MNQEEVYNFEVSQGNFNSLVIMNSYKLPVFTLFMSPSLGSSIELEYALSNLALDFKGQFILARIDVDMEKDLQERYEIKNIPTLKIFKDGNPIHQEIGLLKDNELTDLLKSQGIFHESDDMREQARAEHVAGNTPAAINILTEAIKKDPSNTRVAMDMIQIMLDINLLKQATVLFNKLPDRDKESKTGKALTGQITFKELAEKTKGLAFLIDSVKKYPDNLDNRFDLAICYIAEHGFEEAMNQLFEILDKESNFKGGAAKELAINTINMLEENDPQLSQDSRRILSNMLSQ
jgi:putative thioredoxin